MYTNPLIVLLVIDCILFAPIIQTIIVQSLLSRDVQLDNLLIQDNVLFERNVVGALTCAILCESIELCKSFSYFRRGPSAGTCRGYSPFVGSSVATNTDGAKTFKGVCADVMVNRHIKSIQWSKLGQMSVEGVITSCEEDFITSGENATIWCINNTWFGAGCNRRIFHYPELLQDYAMPRTITPGWKACLRGLLNGDGQVECFMQSVSVNIFFTFPIVMGQDSYDRLQQECEVIVEGEYIINPFNLLSGHELNLTFHMWNQTYAMVTANQSVISTLMRISHALETFSRLTDWHSVVVSISHSWISTAEEN